MPDPRARRSGRLARSRCSARTALCAPGRTRAVPRDGAPPPRCPPCSPRPAPRRCSARSRCSRTPKRWRRAGARRATRTGRRAPRPARCRATRSTSPCRRTRRRRSRDAGAGRTRCYPDAFVPRPPRTAPTRRPSPEPVGSTPRWRDRTPRVCVRRARSSGRTTAATAGGTRGYSRAYPSSIPRGTGDIPRRSTLRSSTTPSRRPPHCASSKRNNIRGDSARSRRFFRRRRTRTVLRSGTGY